MEHFLLCHKETADRQERETLPPLPYILLDASASPAADRNPVQHHVPSSQVTHLQLCMPYLRMPQLHECPRPPEIIAPG